MWEVFGFSAAVALVLVYGWAAVAKAMRPSAWRQALAVYRLPRPADPIVFVAVPGAEILVLVLIFAGASRPAGALSVALLCSFCAALLRARSKEGDRLPCGCFGGNRTRDYRLLLARNVILLIPSLVLMAGATSQVTRVPDRVEAVPALLIVGGLALLGWTAFEVSRAFSGDRGR